MPEDRNETLSQVEMAGSEVPTLHRFAGATARCGMTVRKWMAAPCP